MKISTKFKSLISFKLLTVLIAVMMCFGLVACGAKEEAKPDESAGMPNPVAEYDSLEEINSKIGVNLLQPSVEGLSEERFSVISDEIAEYVCKIRENEWTFRASHITDEDISGVNSELNEFAPNQDSTIRTNEFYLERFFDGGRQYTIVVTDPVSEDGKILIDENEFMDICMEMESIQKLHLDDPLVGDYQEKIIGSTACVERFEDAYNVSVNWTDSAEVYHCWTMYDATKENDKLTYRGEEIGQYTYDENGNETSSNVTMSNNLGFFEIKDGMLYWIGAAQEECCSWVFEKIPEKVQEFRFCSEKHVLFEKTPEKAQEFRFCSEK